MYINVVYKDLYVNISYTSGLHPPVVFLPLCLCVYFIGVLYSEWLTRVPRWVTTQGEGEGRPRCERYANQSKDYAELEMRFCNKPTQQQPQQQQQQHWIFPQKTIGLNVCGLEMILSLETIKPMSNFRLSLQTIVWDIMFVCLFCLSVCLYVLLKCSHDKKLWQMTTRPCRQETRVRLLTLVHTHTHTHPRPS